MAVNELNREQLISLKQHYICETFDTVFWSDLAEADNLISDKTIKREFSDYIFSEDDF